MYKRVDMPSIINLKYTYARDTRSKAYLLYEEFHREGYEKIITAGCIAFMEALKFSYT